MRFPFISTEKMALIDRLQTARMGISITQMMEIAGLDTALLAKRICRGKKIAVLCGKGNNGGDGITAARHLANFGFECTLVFPFSPSKLGGVPKQQLATARKMGIPAINFLKQRKRAMSAIQKSGLVIDCLIGYNLRGNPRRGFAELINAANDSRKKILACDVPSGLDATTWEAFEPCIKSHATLSLTLPKKGLKKRGAKKFVGKTFVGYLTVPDSVLRSAGIRPKNWFGKKLIERSLE